MKILSKNLVFIAVISLFFILIVFKAFASMLYGCAEGTGGVCSLVSNKQFIHIVSPNGTEQWEAGKTYNITWTASEVSTVKITLLWNEIDGSPSSQEIITRGCSVNYMSIDGTTPQNSSTCSYAWSVPVNQAIRSIYRIQVSDANKQYATDLGSDYDVSDNYFSIVPRVFSKPNYNCNYCNGFCFVSDASKSNLCYKNQFLEWNKGPSPQSCMSTSECPAAFTCVDNKCLNYLWENPYNIPIVITPEYPSSVPLNSNFTFTLDIENKDISPIKITVNEINFNPTEGAGSDHHPIAGEYVSTVNANSKEKINISLNSFNKETMTGTVSFLVTTDRILYGGPIFFRLAISSLIVYEPLFEASCGGKKYNKNKAICIDDILYPTGTACVSNSDCSAAYTIAVNSSCIHNTCVVFSKSQENRKYNVGIPKIFIYDDNSLFFQEKDANIAKLEDVANRANNWFVSEPIFLNTQSNFRAVYALLSDSCLINKNEYLELLKSVDSAYLFEKSLLNKCNINSANFDLMATHEFWQEGIADQPIFDEMNRIGLRGVAGTNYGDILRFNQLDYGVLVHETLHSYNEIDIYLQNGYQNAFYQERDCNLFRAQWGSFEKYPHLCNFEAKIIGWVPAATITPTSTQIPVVSPAATPAPLPILTPIITPVSSTAKLYRAIGDSKVYIIQDEKKEWIRTAEEFNIKGYNWNDIKDVSFEMINQLLGYNSVESSKQIPEGAIIQANGEADVYIIKYAGGKAFKRLILNPSVFRSYGHLKWENIIKVDRITLNNFITSNLVRSVKSGKIYSLIPNGDIGIRRTIKDNITFQKLGFDPSSIYEINETDENSYTEGQDLN